MAQVFTTAGSEGVARLRGGSQRSRWPLHVPNAVEKTWTAHAAWRNPLRPLRNGGTEFPTPLPAPSLHHSLRLGSCRHLYGLRLVDPDNLGRALNRGATTGAALRVGVVGRFQNRVLRELHGNKRLRFTDGQRRRLAAKGKSLGRKILGGVCSRVALFS